MKRRGNRKAGRTMTGNCASVEKSRGVHDEMEQSIMIRAGLCAWITLMVGLLVFTVVYSIAAQRFDLLSAVPLIMALVSLVVYALEKRVLTKEMIRPESEDDEE